MNAITIENVRVAYETQVVLENVTLTIATGEIVAVLGASGCGKSTLLRAIAGLDVRPAGRIDVSGEIGFVFQEPRLFPWLSVEGNVRFAARTPEERARVDLVLELTGLSNARHVLPKALSGGMAQRAALARTLIRKPSILLLDEPMAALDALRRITLQQALAQIIETLGTTAVLVTHDIEEALYLADRIIVLGGEPSHITLELNVPVKKRRNRDANLSDERAALFRALALEHAIPEQLDLRHRFSA